MTPPPDLPMTTPDGLTAESEALLATLRQWSYNGPDDEPFHRRRMRSVTRALRRIERAVGKRAVALHVRETGCGRLREALRDSTLLMHDVMHQPPRETWRECQRDSCVRARAALASPANVKDCACNESSNCFAHPNALATPATEEVERGSARVAVMVEEPWEPAVDDAGNQYLACMTCGAPKPEAPR